MRQTKILGYFSDLNLCGHEPNKGSTGRDWSQSIPEIDQQLYKMYKLSEEEIAFMERMIKPMV